MARAILTALLCGGLCSTAPAHGAPPATPATVTGHGVTLRSVSVDLPFGKASFPGGAGAKAVNNNCLACHSASMVLNQPKLSRTAWQSEVDKMVSVYKAPVTTADVPAIVNYLSALPARPPSTPRNRPAGAGQRAS